MKKNSGNILLIILVVAGILAASVGGYFWWTTKNQKITESPKIAKPKDGGFSADPTANWKTYENVEYDYSIKYPQESTFLEPQLIPSESPAGPIYSLVIVLPKLSVPYGAATSIPAQLRMTYLPKNTPQKAYGHSLDSKIRASRARIQCPNGEVIGPVNLLISGKPAEKIIENKCDKDTHYATYKIASANETFVSIQYLDGKAKAQYESVFDQILSTFKFIDQK